MSERPFNLLVAACRNAYGDGSEGMGPVANAADWSRFLDLARRHRVQALAWHGLAQLQSDVPADLAEQLRSDSSAIIGANLRQCAECGRLKDLFDRSGIDLLFLKGLTVGALAYPNPLLKMGWDIDVLINPAALGSAARALRSAGYLLVTPASASDERMGRWHRRKKESVWRHAATGLHVELHTRLADNTSLLPSIGMASPRQMVRIAGSIDLPTLGKDELFAYLCVHGASSAWFRLKWITDLAAMLHRAEAAEIERLYEVSLQLGAGRTAAQALMLAKRLYSTKVSDALLRRLESSMANRWLVRVAGSELRDIREPTAHVLGTMGIRVSQLPLISGWRYALSEGLRQTGEIMAARTRWN